MNQTILTKEFSLASVLGALSGYLLSDKGMSEIHELLEWVVGEPVFTHQIPYVMPSIAKSLVRQFPQLDCERPEMAAAIRNLVCAFQVKDEETVSEIWWRLKQDHGETLHVAPLQPFDEYEHPPLITPNIEGKALILNTPPSDEFPGSI